MAVTTVYTYPLNSSTREFTVPFEYLARRFVTVTLIGTNRRELVLNDDFRFISQSIIQTTLPWGPGDGYENIEIRRNTSASERLVDFADGSILRAYELNISQVQTMHVAEEARNMVTDTIGVNNDGDLDARGRRIVNLADALEPDHAVTLRQEQDWAASTLGHKTAAETAKTLSEAAANTSSQKAANSATSAQASLTQANRSATEADRSRDEADRSATEADRSKDEADRSVNAAATIGNNVTLAQTAATQSGTARDEAVTARDDARLARDDAQDAIGNVRSAAFQLGMSTWGFRASVWAGFAPDDGQELPRALYPEFAAALDAGMLPTVTQAVWAANPDRRGHFVAVSSPGMFRMRDLNGKSPGTLGAVFQRGDGLNAGLSGRVQLDGFKEHKHLSGLKYVNAYMDLGSAYGSEIDSELSNVGYHFSSSTANAQGRPYVSPEGGAETRPINVAGCWMTRLFGEVTNIGAADAAQLASSYAALAGRVSTLEGRRIPKTYYSPVTVQVANSVHTFNHGLGKEPDIVQLFAVCHTDHAAAGYSVGNVIPIPSIAYQSGNQGVSITVTNTQLRLRINSAGLGYLSGYNVAGQFTATAANYNFKVKAFIF